MTDTIYSGWDLEQALAAFRGAAGAFGGLAPMEITPEDILHPDTRDEVACPDHFDVVGARAAERAAMADAGLGDPPPWDPRSGTFGGPQAVLHRRTSAAYRDARGRHNLIGGFRAGYTPATEDAAELLEICYGGGRTQAVFMASSNRYTVAVSARLGEDEASVRSSLEKRFEAGCLALNALTEGV